MSERWRVTAWSWDPDNENYYYDPAHESEAGTFEAAMEATTAIPTDGAVEVVFITPGHWSTDEDEPLLKDWVADEARRVELTVGDGGQWTAQP